MNFFTSYSNIALVMGSLTFFLMTSLVFAAPMDTEDEQVENALLSRPDVMDNDITWNALNSAALRKMLLQMDAEDRFGINRESRSWPKQSRGWGARSLEGQIARPWRADKRQARFRQCYFNPISCFRK
ncbi:unnamed protein product [Colias eurytheme]|nr:unnamed protein product [Colias eurytheme]